MIIATTFATALLLLFASCAGTDIHGYGSGRFRRAATVHAKESRHRDVS